MKEYIAEETTKEKKVLSKEKEGLMKEIVEIKSLNAVIE